MPKYKVSAGNGTLTVVIDSNESHDHPVDKTGATYNPFGDAAGANDIINLYLLGRPDLDIKGSPADFLNGAGALVGTDVQAVKTYFLSLGISRSLTPTLEDGTQMVGGATEARQIEGNGYLQTLSTGFDKFHYRPTSASTNTVIVQSGPTKIGYIELENNSAAPKYYKIYDKGSKPVIGVDLPFKNIMANAGNSRTLAYSKPIVLNSGLAYALTTGPSDTDTGATGAGDVNVNITYS